MSAPTVVVAGVGTAPIVTDELVERVMDRSAGAVATFEGRVRDHHQGKVVSHLEYEAYAPMATRELERVLATAVERFAIERIAARHRIGRLEIGDIAVAIAVSAAHRDAAFEALRYAIDTIKETVPIWKRESGPDGAFWIEGPDRIAVRR